MMFTDTPSPGSGYLIFNFLVVLFLLLIPLYIKIGDSLRKKLILPVTVISLGGAVVFALFIHAGFDTQYMVDDDYIYIRNGLIQRTTVDLRSIETIRRETLIRQPIGYTLKWKGFSNRYINGISLKTGDRVIYLTPSDTDRFLRELRVRIEKARDSGRIGGTSGM